MPNSLIVRVLAGDRESYAAVVEAFQDMLVAFASFLVPDRGTAEELAHLTFIRAYGGGDGARRCLRYKARILSGEAHRDLELSCRLRIRGSPLAEVQVGDYNWFFEVPAGTGWVEFRLRQRGATLSAHADGIALVPQPGADAGAAPRAGPLAFYMRSGSLEIVDARILE